MGRRPPFFVINRVVVYLDKTNKLASSFFALCFSVFFGNEVCGQISITLTGSWSETINAADLTAGPGSDLQDSYESAADAASLSISGTGGVGDTWRIDVKKVDEVFLKDNADAAQARENLRRYFRFYNTPRPHQSLEYRTPA